MATTLQLTLLGIVVLTCTAKAQLYCSADQCGDLAATQETIGTTLNWYMWHNNDSMNALASDIASARTEFDTKVTQQHDYSSTIKAHLVLVQWVAGVSIAVLLVCIIILAVYVQQLERRVKNLTNGGAVLLNN